MKRFLKGLISDVDDQDQSDNDRENQDFKKKCQKKFKECQDETLSLTPNFFQSIFNKNLILFFNIIL